MIKVLSQFRMLSKQWCDQLFSLLPFLTAFTLLPSSKGQFDVSAVVGVNVLSHGLIFW